MDTLEPDERNFARRFLLASGSLKDLAAEYGVSYPTIRQRLDELIGKVRRTVKDERVGELRRVVRRMVEDGALDLTDARKLLTAGDKDLKEALRRQSEGSSE